MYWRRIAELWRLITLLGDGSLTLSLFVSVFYRPFNRFPFLFLVGFFSTRLSNAEAPTVELSRLQGKDYSAKPNPIHIEIDRAPGSELCPDESAVFQALARLFPERSVQNSNVLQGSVTAARITIRPTTHGHEALILTVLPRIGERTLMENDASCSGLADALAVTLALLSQVRGQENAIATQKTVVTTPPQTQKAAKEKAENSESFSSTPTGPLPNYQSVPVVLPEFKRWKASQKSNMNVTANVASVGGIGLLNSPSAGAALGAELFHRSGFGLTFQGVRLWSVPLHKEGGSVKLTLWGGALGGCYRHRVTSRSNLDTCFQFAAGQQRPLVNGFAHSRSEGVPWVVLGPKLRYLFGVTRAMGTWASLGFIGQAMPQSFSARRVDGSGENLTVAEAPHAGLMVELGLRFGSDVF
jgi:hypothetical protein